MAATRRPSNPPAQTPSTTEALCPDATADVDVKRLAHLLRAARLGPSSTFVRQLEHSLIRQHRW